MDLRWVHPARLAVSGRVNGIINQGIRSWGKLLSFLVGCHARIHDENIAKQSEKGLS